MAWLYLTYIDYIGCCSHFKIIYSVGAHFSYIVYLLVWGFIFISLVISEYYMVFDLVVIINMCLVLAFGIIINTCFLAMVY